MKHTTDQNHTVVIPSATIGLDVGTKYAHTIPLSSPATSVTAGVLACQGVTMRDFWHGIKDMLGTIATAVQLWRTARKRDRESAQT